MLKMPTLPRTYRIAIFAGLFLCAAILSACATQPDTSAMKPPGFFRGLFHGFTILFSFIASIFTDYRIYAYPNSGWWYDLGYLIGASAFLGGGGASARGTPSNTPTAPAHGH
jgi:hypothetical protein